MASPQTAIVSHGEVVKEPAEVYGTGPVLLRVGNGGAGATGVIKALAEDYLATLPRDPAQQQQQQQQQHAIAWVCNHSRNTQLALLHGHVDVALTYERDQEALAAAEGWARPAGCVMHDHFCLAGPADDPAGVRGAASLSDALRRIVDAAEAEGEGAGAGEGEGVAKVSFHSRADASATMWKERALWRDVGMRPWEGCVGGGGPASSRPARPWYETSVLSPAEALVRADAAGAYLLTDRSTLLRQAALGRLSARTTVFCEPDAADHVLMNSCFALVRSAGAGAGAGAGAPAARAFVDYLLGDRAQSLLAAYGAGETGLPLFARAADGFARTTLVGGRAVGGKWVARPAA